MLAALCKEGLIHKSHPPLRDFPLTHRPKRGFLPAPQPDPLFPMAKICSITGAHVRIGRKIHRSGLAKKKGGIGRHVTQVNKRSVSPNLQTKRIWVPELGRHIRLKLSARAIKTINKNGALVTLKKAGIV